MSQHRAKLEQALEYMTNEETEAVSDLLHTIVVEMARDIYEEIVDEEADEDTDAVEEMEESEEEAIEEDFGGDVKDDFATDIAQDEEEVDSDEMYDDQDSEDDSDEDSDDDAEAIDGDLDLEGEDEPVEDRVEDLETALMDLRAEFDRLMGDDMGDDEMDMDADMDMDSDEYEMGDEEAAEPEMEGFYEEVGEATQLTNPVADPGMGQEGKLSGTGAKSKAGTVSKEAPYTKAPAKKDHGGKPTDFSKSSGNGQGKEVDKSAKKVKTEDNIDVKQGEQSADLSGENKHSGTGKNSKTGATQTKSPLTKKPS